ncbi:WAP, Kazal, immunoglobulin, Kunitz and NTR domain-containing protein 2-like [Branchiostoma floridae]|uniref:WAP, Kazal, immunoglobulin, Kunitz and NTR domain-containing protein 2-like n=1 Tax=Branchiostoma floridae TaxID=7739 RepID=A0A9J7HD79_BRAFL|nr:WAP, Kazal, immunoglobulin, Kunitz and NTR domain-containing protein 2-like [Branchiostoma floridae]
MKMLVSLVILAVISATYGQGAPRQKDGSCPPVDLDSFGLCADLCDADGDCPGELLCCPNACGATVCQEPVLQTTEAPPEPPTDPCLEVTCVQQGASCEVMNGQAMCRCPSDCSRFGQSPVCDMSGNSYNNQCVLDAVACQLGITLETVTCPQPTAPVTEAPATQAPATEAPATEAPATEAPARPQPGTCTLPPKTGRCRAFTLRHYHHAGTGRCLRFVYGGCGSNGNNFRSLAECQRQCGAPPPYTPGQQDPDVCSLPLDAGPKCGQFQVRYYYRSEDEGCHLYVHGGCQGNGNSFVSRKACEARCKPAACAPCPVRWSERLSKHYCHSGFVITGRVTNIRRVSPLDDRSIVQVRVTEMHRGGGLVLDGRTRTAMIITENQFAECACPNLSEGNNYILMGDVSGGYGMVSRWNYARPLDSAAYRDLMNVHHSGNPCRGYGR